MPKVGNRLFGYSDAEKERAYLYADQTGQPIQEVNQFGNEAPMKSLDKNRFGRRDKKKKSY